jgi:hypothetical protein
LQLESHQRNKKPRACWILKANLLYFAIVFGVGFVLGPICILWIVPLLALPSTASIQLALSCIVRGLLLVEKFTLMLRLGGLLPSEYFASRNPKPGTVCNPMPGMFAKITPILRSFSFYLMRNQHGFLA